MDTQCVCEAGKSYIWRICSSKSVKRVRNNNYNDVVRSEIFRIQEIDFALNLYPAGGKTSGRGNVALYLCVENIPNNINNFRFEYNVNLIEANIQKYATSEYKRKYFDQARHFLRIIMKTDQFLKFKSFTFKIDLKIIQMYNKKGNIIKMNMNNNKIRKLLNTSYLWIIGNKTELQSDIFMRYGLEWYLRLTNDKNNRILLSLGLKTNLYASNISKIKVLCTCVLNHTGCTEQWTTEYNKNTPKSTSFGVLFEKKELIKFNEFAFDVQMTMLNIVDLKGNQLSLPFPYSPRAILPIAACKRSKRGIVIKYCKQCGVKNYSDTGYIKKRKMRLCSGCQKVHYCTRRCQKIAWKFVHKYQCGYLF
eukprot:134626_1